MGRPAELTHEERPWGDTYVGSADALIAAGLVTADQLPGVPGNNKFTCTFYDGRPVKRGATNHLRNERYLRIARRGRKFEAFRGVSDQVSDERRAALQRERERDAAAKRQDEKREVASKKTPEDFREACSRSTGFMRMHMDGVDGLYPFEFPPDARAKMEEALRELEAIIQSSEVLPLHPKKANTGKGHLHLAWSAPQ